MHQLLISLTPAKVIAAKKLFYTSNELNLIRSQCQHNQKLRLIDVDVLNRIRSLKIAKRRKRGRKGGIARDTSGCYQPISIIIVLMLVFQDLDYKFMKKLLNIGLGNLRSVKWLGNDFVRIFGQYLNDAFIIMETWLKGNDLDKA